MATVDPVLLINKEVDKTEDLALCDRNAPGRSNSPISYLPNELLAAIFLLCAGNHFYSFSGYPNEPVPSWVNVSYVCRHWREVALNCPTLWTFLFIKSPRWTTKLLARSKKASLKIFAKANAQMKLAPVLNFLEQVMEDLERIEDLRILTPHPGTNCQSLSNLLFIPAPRLRNLEISRLSIPERLSSLPFLGETPALRTLALSNCSLPWYSFTLDSLTTLRLSCIPTRSQPHMTEFLAVLGRIRGLEYLYLHDALPGANGLLASGELDSTPRINLPCLSYLFISSPLSTVVAFLSYINVPLKTEFRLRCQSERTATLDDYFRLSPLLAQRFHASDDRPLTCPTIRSVVIERAFLWMTLAFSTSRSEPSSPGNGAWDHNIPLRVDLMFTSMIYAQEDRIISHICSSLPMINVYSLHVICPPFSLCFWNKLLRQLPNLRFLKLSDGRMPDIASLLSLDCAFGDADRSENGIFVPALEELEVHHIEFSAKSEVETRVAAPALDLQSLYDAFATRKEPQCGLTVTQCHVEMEGRLPDMVGWWDGDQFKVTFNSDRVEGVDHYFLPIL